MTDNRSPFDALLARAGGYSGLVYTSLPVTVFALALSFADLTAAIVASLGTAAAVLAWQLIRRESLRPSLFGFVAVAGSAAYALITGRAKDFYLPGIWSYLAAAIVFTLSVLIRWPLVGVGWAWITGRDGSWRRVRRVRVAFDLATLVLAVAGWSRFGVQYYLYETNQTGLLGVARIAMGWPVFLITSTSIYFAIRTALRALPRTSATEDDPHSEVTSA